MLTCPTCGELNRPTARFCKKCRLDFTTAISSRASARIAAGVILQGRYRIDRELGKGGFGAAYLATDMRLKRSCVVKQMLIPVNTTYAELYELQSAFEREAGALVELNVPGHPNIPEIYDYFSDAIGNFLVMKYIQGESVEARLLRLGGKMPAKDALGIALQIADALAYLHGHKPTPMMHRDVKPANLLMDTTGRAWLVDFGLSKAQPASGGTVGLSEPMGTEGYAPPEQYKRDGAQPVPRSDVFALAVTLYEMLSGDQCSDHPFLYPMLQSLPPEIRAVLDPSLDLNPSNRLSSSELKIQLEHLARPDKSPSFVWKDQTRSKQPSDLVAVADAHWDEARTYLTDGKWQKWFNDLHRNDLVAQLQQVRSRHANEDIALDAFLRILDSSYAPPQLRVNPTIIPGVSVPWQSQATLTFEIENTGSGCLVGKIAQLPPWLSTSVYDFAIHDRKKIMLGVDTRALTPSVQAYTGRFSVVAGGDQATVSATVSVPEPQLVINSTLIDLGTAHQGETRQQSFSIANKGGSYFDADLSCNVNWATVTPSHVQVRPGQTQQVNVLVDTSKMRVGQHAANVQIQAKVGDWSQDGTAQVAVQLPWFKTFWWRWASALDWAVVGMIFSLAWFGFSRFPSGELRKFLNGALSSVTTDPMFSVFWWLLLILLGGGIGVFIRRSRSFPWRLAMLIGAVLTVTGVGLGLVADFWLGIATSLALCLAIGAALMGLSHRNEILLNRNLAGWVGMTVPILMILFVTYLGIQPRFWWRQTQEMEFPSSTLGGIVLSAHGQLLAGANYGGKYVQIWGTDDGAPISTLEDHNSQLFNILAFSPDGRMLASAAEPEKIRLWEVADGAVLHDLKADRKMTETVTASPDGRLMASGNGDGTVRIWRVNDGAQLWALNSNQGGVYSVAFDPETTVLATGGSDGTVVLFRVATGLLIKRLWLKGHVGGVRSVHFDSDDLLVTLDNRETVRTWRISDSTLHNEYDGRSVGVASVAVSSDGQLLASGDVNGNVRLWNTSDGSLLRRLESHAFSEASLAFSPDGEVLASGNTDGNVRLWRTSDGTLLGNLMVSSSGITTVAYSPDGHIVAAGNANGEIQLWSVDERMLIRTVRLSNQGRRNAVTSLAYSPVGDMLVSGYADGAVRLWRVENGIMLRKLLGHTSSVDSIAFYSDGNSLISSERGLAKLWWVGE